MGDKPRALTALICAYQETEEAEAGLRALLPVAGRTLVERQARIAATAGATSILLVADPSNRAIAAAIDRLRANGFEIRIARDGGEAGRAVEASDTLLLLADGALVDEDEVARFADGGDPALLTVADEGHDDRFERIDADARWAGAALVDGRLVRDTAAMLDDWDFQSTLLRRAVQQGARQVRAAQDAEPVMAARPEDLVRLEADILRGAGGGQRDWVSRYLLAPVEAEATRRLVARAATPIHLFGSSLALQLLSAGAFVTGWLWLGLLLFLLSTPLIGIGERLGRLAGLDRVGSRLRWLLSFTAAAALLALGRAAAVTDGWGAAVLAMAAIAFTVALEGERPRRTGAGLFLAEPKGMAWLMLPFAAIGQGIAGLCALTLYAGASFFIAQRQAHAGFRKD